MSQPGTEEVFLLLNHLGVNFDRKLNTTLCPYILAKYGNGLNQSKYIIIKIVKQKLLILKCKLVLCLLWVEFLKTISNKFPEPLPLCSFPKKKKKKHIFSIFLFCCKLIFSLSDFLYKKRF